MASLGKSRLFPLLLAATVALGSASGASAAGFFSELAHFSNPVAASNDLDARQGSIQERLRDAMEAGRLTDESMHAIQLQLQKIAAEEALAKSKDGELSYRQISKLQAELDGISKDLEAHLTERQSGPVDVVAMRDRLSTRLSDALAVHKVSQPAYDQFFAALTKIDKMIAQAKGPDGLLTINDQVRIALDLDNLSQRFTAGESQRKSDMSAIDERRDELRALIREGVANGHLTEDEVDDLRQQLYTYEDKETRMSNMGRPVTADELLAMALELERFGAEIRARMDNGTEVKISERTIGYRKSALDQTFANSLFAGDIDPTEAQDFKSSLDQITGTENTLRAEDGGQLTMDHIQSLLITIEKLKGRFSRLTYNREKPWSGVDGMVNDIKQKIAVATAAKQLTDQQNDDLQSKIADVLVAKSNERITQGLINTETALKLAAEIATLRDQVVKIIGQGNVVSVPVSSKHH